MTILNKLNDGKGFTLIELIVVMAIIAILVLLAAPKFLGYTKDANVTAMQQDVKVLSDAAERHRIETEKWPVKDKVLSHGVGGVDELYHLDQKLIKEYVNNIEGDYSDYALSLDEQYEGKIFHLSGVESKDGVIYFGSSLKLSPPGSPLENVGDNLVKNGLGELGDNTNFPEVIYDNQVTYEGRPTFRSDTKGGHVTSQELIPVDADKKYRFSYAIKTAPGPSSRFYGMVKSYDIDELLISQFHINHVKDATTTLAEDLKPGDKMIHLKDAKHWHNNDDAIYRRRIMFWNYTNSLGEVYPVNTYTRNISDFGIWDKGAVDFENNTITLNKDWNGPFVKKGTPVSNGDYSGSYTYLAGVNKVTPIDWTTYTGTLHGYHTSGRDTHGKFRPGTEYVKVGWLTNRDIVTPLGTWVADVEFREVR